MLKAPDVAEQQNKGEAAFGKVLGQKATFGKTFGTDDAFAALVEENAAASNSLSDQANRLADEISFFQLR